jgi:hypothetical protein
MTEVGLLEAVEEAVAAAGGRTQDAWIGASEWSRDSDLLSSLASVLGPPKAQIDGMFRSTDFIHR